MCSRKAGIILWALLLLFFLRVLGQIVVAIWAPTWLPPMEAWYSGLMPYHYLLPSQIAILLLFGKAALDLTRGRGYWFKPKKHLGKAILILGVVYFLGMILRYWIQGLSIPVVFHWVLASYLLVFGWYNSQD